MTPEEKKAADEAAKKKAEIDAAEAKKIALKAAADAEAERIMKSDEGANTNNDDVAPKRDKKFKTSYELLHRVTLSYPQSTPNEHVVFGFGGYRVSLGDLRNLFSNPL